MPPLLSLLAVALFAAAAVTDLRSRRIPNQISLVLAGLALVRIGMALAAGVGWSAAGLDLVAAVASSRSVPARFASQSSAAAT
jgi:Flp pilus assembly protein protease CpaA